MSTMKKIWITALMMILVICAVFVLTFTDSVFADVDNVHRFNITYDNITPEDFDSITRGSLTDGQIISDDYRTNNFYLTIGHYFGKIKDGVYDKNSGLMYSNPEFELTDIIINGVSYKPIGDGWDEFLQEYNQYKEIIQVESVTSPLYDGTYNTLPPIEQNNNDYEYTLAFQYIETTSDINIRFVFAGETPIYTPSVESDSSLASVTPVFLKNGNGNSKWRIETIPVSGLRLDYAIDTQNNKYTSSDGKTVTVDVTSSDEVLTLFFRQETTPILNLELSNYGMVYGDNLWIQCGAKFDEANAESGYPFQLFITNKEDGSLDDALIIGEKTVVGEIPLYTDRTAYRKKKCSYGLLIKNLAPGEYYIGAAVSTSKNVYYSYAPFVVYEKARDYIKAGIDRIVDSYISDWFTVKGQDGEYSYVGLDQYTDSYGNEWEAWIYPALGTEYDYNGSTLSFDINDTFLHPGIVDSNWAEQLEQKYSEQNNIPYRQLCMAGPKLLFKQVTALCACGKDPRNVGGVNLIKVMLEYCHNSDGSLSINSNGAYTPPDWNEFPDDLAVSYLFLAFEIAGANKSDGYTNEIRRAGIKAVLNNTRYGDYTLSDSASMGALPLAFFKDDEVYGDACRERLEEYVQSVSQYNLCSNGALRYPPDNSEDNWMATDADSSAVAVNTLVLTGLTADDITSGSFKKKNGTMLSALCGEVIEGGVIYGGSLNRMATYQTLGALVDLYNGRSCFEIARDKYKENYPQYFVPGEDDGPVVAKKKQPMTVKPVLKKVSFKKLKKKAQVVKGALIVKHNKGKVSYKRISGSKKLTINKKTGRITVKKKTKKGTYKIRVKVTAAGNSLFKAGSKIVTVKIRVK